MSLVGWGRYSRYYNIIIFGEEAEGGCYVGLVEGREGGREEGRVLVLYRAEFGMYCMV